MSKFQGGNLKIELHTQKTWMIYFGNKKSSMLFTPVKGRIWGLNSSTQLHKFLMIKNNICE